MRRRLLALALGVALPTVLLGAGWLRASQGERDAVEREERARLERSADTLGAAVDEGLEELRRQEDARPFYLYNHFYSPPAVVAVNDPVAITPLASDPTDARIVGYFQIDPDGSTHTPYTASPEDAPTERARRIAMLLTSPDFASLRALTHVPGEESISLLAAAVPPAVTPAPMPPRRPVRRRRPTPGPPPEPEPVPPQLAQNEVAPAENPFAPQGPLTVNLNTWGNQVFDDIQAAQAGNEEANTRVQARGRAAPVTRRRQVQWDAYGAESQQAQSSRRAPARTAREQPPTPAGPTLTNRTQQEAEVGYTDMAWYEASQELVLHRIVSHAGAAVVQGVVLDRDEIIHHWLPSLVERHGVTGSPRVVTNAEHASCSYRRQVSHILAGVELCYPASALTDATAAMDASQDLQRGALLGLLLIIAIALFVFDRAARQREELARQKSAFVSAVSHELRTPLTTIRMHAEMLDEGLVSAERRPRVYGELVHESVRLARLVENVLEVSRLDEGKRPLHAQRGDLRAGVARAVADHRPFVERKGFRVSGPEEGAPIELDFDAQALEQIVVNLLDNALKYAATGEREISVNVTSDELQAWLSVRDHGPGIPAAEREKVFERFHRVERAETAHSPGTGIGLSLVRDLALAHGGSCEVREAEGGGAEIVVIFPIT